MLWCFSLLNIKTQDSTFIPKCLYSSLFIYILDKKNVIKGEKKMEMGKMEISEYVMRKLKLEEYESNGVNVLRRMYKDRDIGCNNWELWKVKSGKKWFRKSDRKK